MTGSGPSRTALLVAAGVVFASSEPDLRDLVDSDAVALARRLLQSTRPSLLRLIDSPNGRKLIRWLERCTIPGIIRHWNCRKQWIERTWRQARRDEYDMLVILGSGFDTLSLRTARAGGGMIRTVDVDHPATLAARRAALAGFDIPGHSFFAYDLSEPDLRASLERVILRDNSVFVVIEGVLMYLPPQRVNALFRELAGTASRRMRIAFSFMEQAGGSRPAFRPRSRLIDGWLRVRGEPFRSGLDPSRLDEWLKGLGFQLLSFAPTPDEARAVTGALRGECVSLAERVE